MEKKTTMKLAHKFLYLLISVSILIGCGFGITGKGPVEKRTLDVEYFSQIEVSGFFKVHYRQGPKHEVILATQENLFEYAEVMVEDKVLYISSGEIKEAKELTVFVTSPNLFKIECSGATDFSSANKIISSQLSISTSGAAEAKVSTSTPRLEVKASGASNIELLGDCEMAKIESSGASSIEGLNLKCDEVKIESSGASNVSIQAITNLIANGSGASTIEYKGSPNVKAEMSGASNIVKK